MEAQRTSLKEPAAVIVIIVPALLALAQVFHLHLINRSQLALGLPIDDAYIFMRYAENLAGGHGFSFNPGETSFGCTSVVWPVILAALFRGLYFLEHATISFWLGGFLFALAGAGTAAVVLRATNKSALGLLAGIMVSASPLMLMNGVSGMETPLTMALLIVMCALMLGKKPLPIAAGLVAGILTLNRPECLYFPLGAILAGLILKAARQKGLEAITIIKFVVPWAVLAVPVGLFIHHHTGSFLPTTYMGKIMSTDPATIDRGALDRLVWAALSLGDGWVRLATPLRAASILLALGIGFEMALVFRSLWTGADCALPSPSGKGPLHWPLMGRIVLFGYLFLPAAYGFFFPVGPAFGGYYIRYIASVHVVFVVLGVIGLASILRIMIARYPLMSKHRRVIYPSMVFIVLVYQGWLWSFEFRDCESVFKSEVKLNTGIRMDAARWISSADNVAVDARVMVGYTGLGVVGGQCRRYALDLGALINPDIFEYYRRAAKNPKARWEQMVEYMRDRGIGYYVTFAFTPEYANTIYDPARTPGFFEVARLGVKTEPKNPYEQIRVYRIDWERHKAALGD